MISAQEQLEQLKLGTVDFINESEMRHKLTTQKKLKVKFGADPTRPDLHLGHTVVLNKLRQFQDLGHQVQFIIGDFTAMIGDPTGKNEMRPPLSVEEIKKNSLSYQEQVFKVLKADQTETVYNSDWFRQIGAEGMIKLASQYTIARLLERDDFSKRFSSHTPIAMHEMLYPLVQGYDSVHLKSDVELGGTDQKFNLIVGRELQKSYGLSQQQCVVTLPILEGLDGVQKMSKSADNYISVVESPKDMFGKTMRVSDELMLRWYELLTSITPVELAQLKTDLQSGKKHPRQVKVDLAKFVVRRFHGDQAAKQAEEEFNRIFVNKGLPDEMREIVIDPQVISLAQFLASQQLVSSNSEGRRMIQSRAVELDGQKVTDEKMSVEFKSHQSMVIKVGKKLFVKVKVR